MSAPFAPHGSALAARDDLVTRLDRLGPMGQRDAIRAELAAHGVVVEQPADHDGYALSLHGIFVIGTTESDAIRQWHCTARHQMGGWPQVNSDPALRLAQIDWAMWALHHQLHVSRKALRNAVTIIRTLSHNAILLARATEIATAQNLFPTPERQADAQ